MNYKAISKGNLQTLAILAGVLLIVYVLYKIRALVLYAFIAGVVALIGRPIVQFLTKKLKFSKTLSAAITLLIVTTSIALIVRIFLPVVIEQGKNISEINFDTVKRDLNELNIQASEYLGVDKINIVEAIKRTDFIKDFNSEFITSFVEAFFDNIGMLVASIFSVLFISFFLLKDDRMVSNTVTLFADPGKEWRFLKVLRTSRQLLTRYFVGLLIQNTIIGIFYFGLLLYLDVNNPLAIAIICAFLNIVPYLGPLLGGAVIMLVVVSNNLGADFSSVLLPLLLTVLIGVSIIQLIDNLLSQPIIFSKSVKSHPLEIFVIIIAGGLLFGIAGMILAVPVYTTIKVISKEFLSEYKLVKHLTKNM